MASAGATRIRKFVRYLPTHGWDPIVITGTLPPQPLDDAALDSKGLAELPCDLALHRISSWWDAWPTRIAELAAGWVSRLTGNQKWANTWERGLEWRLQRVFDRCALPDRYVHRVLPAIRAAIRFHRSERIDAVFSSGMPFSDHLAAMIIAQLIRRPWVAEFRDPWAEYIHESRPPTPFETWFTTQAEGAVMRRADRIISVNDYMTDRFKDRYPTISASKFVTIRNGFDPGDFAPVAKDATKNTFRLVYAGSLGHTRRPHAVLEGFRRFLQLTPAAVGAAQLRFAGRAGPHAAEFQHTEDGGSIVHLGLLPQAQAIREMMQASVNLLLLPGIPGSQGDTTTKLYECLATERPILAIVPTNGAAARELQTFDGVFVCDPDDIQQIAETIGRLFSDWSRGALTVNRPPDLMHPLTRQHQAGQLASLLDNLASRPNQKTSTSP